MHACDFDHVDTWTTWKIKLARILYFMADSFSFSLATSFVAQPFIVETSVYEPASQIVPNSNAACCSKVAKLFDCYRVYFVILVHGQLAHWSIGPWSIGLLVHWSIGLLVHWSNGWMSNFNKVKLLSERTSGVPPVIFIQVSSYGDWSPW